ncbi:hypothetical protein FBU30_004288 [Linnemannia zychae]|nr:hypothetical protein FBU30_004288 [Linnemannia zychae]
MERPSTYKSLKIFALEILLHYLPLDKTRWDSVLLEQRRLYYSFVKDLIVEPELGEADFIKDEREDSDWSLFLQDNKTLEQIDKDLPIPYSPFCPLSIDPRTREPKKKHKSAKKTDVTDTATPTATVSLTAMDDKTIATHNKSDDCVVSTLARPLEFSSLLKTQTPPNSLPNFPSDSISMLSKSFPKSGLNSWINVASGGTHTHYGFQTPPITGTMPSTLKRRQTVTVMSPRAERKLERLDTPANERDSWASNSNPTTTTTIDNGFETPPLSNGFRMPNNDTVDFNDIGVAYSSPVPSKLKDVKSLLTESEDKSSTPVLPDYLFSPIPTRRSLFKRVAHLNQDFGSREHQPHTVQASRSQENWMKKRQDMLDHSRKTAKEAAAAAAMPMAMTTSPIDVPLSSSPDSIAGNSQSNRKAKQDPELDGCDHERDNEDMKEDDEDELPQDLHWEAIERILFIYAKLNPGVGYVQGMNEILGPLYYLLANDPDEVSRAHAEAESFWLFHLLMAHFRDHFVRSLDRDRVSGIGSSIARMNLRLKQFDEELWQDLEEKGIAPEYYSFRWLTVLCTQEFEVPDVWRIWDSVLADTGGVEKDYDFLLDLGCAMVW